jgi:molybdate transport system ATP-binding protein
LPHGISALFGPSGSGKSTCLALIAGLLKPAAGAIRLGEAVLVDRTNRQWRPPHRRRVGLVCQDHLLFPHLTVRANLAYGMTRATIKGIGEPEVVEVLELGDLLDRYPAQLSGGEQRRVALGRTLLAQPQLLMMDEPLAALDEPLRNRILKYLQTIHAHWKMPILLVSHDQVSVRRLAAHVVIIEEGRVVDQGPVTQTLDRATLQTLSNPPGPINLLRIERVRQVQDHGEGFVGDQPFYVPGRSPTETVFIRCLPSDVALSLHDVQGISMRNHLRGCVRDIVRVSDASAGESVYVAVDVGQILWVHVTTSACREMALTVGSPVVCLIKAAATERVDCH